ncbi:hypothetical protein Tco_0058366 [Tanacetum coccineum]
MSTHVSFPKRRKTGSLFKMNQRKMDMGEKKFQQRQEEIELQRRIDVKDPSTDTPFIFDIGQHTLEFGRREFCLVTGFRFGDCSLDHLSGGQSGFRDRVFLGIARGGGVADGAPFVKDDYDRLFHVRSRLSTLIPFVGEMNKTWWRSSLEYFHNVSNASASSHGPLKTKNSRLKRKAFISHTHVCTEVCRESFSSFTENPDNRAALMNKIMDMEVEFQRRITAIEQYLKIPTSSNVEKTSNVIEECIDVDLNVVEQQYVAGKNLIYEFKQQVASKNLINDEEPHVAGKNFIDEEDQQFSSKNLEVSLKGEELFAVESLMKMIDFDIPKEDQQWETAQSMITDP